MCVLLLKNNHFTFVLDPLDSFTLLHHLSLHLYLFLIYLILSSATFILSFPLITSSSVSYKHILISPVLNNNNFEKDMFLLLLSYIFIYCSFFLGSYCHEFYFWVGILKL